MIQSSLKIGFILLIALFYGTHLLYAYNYGQGQIGGIKIKNIEICQNLAETAQGLGGRTVIEKDYGMLFLFDLPASEHLFWMKGMVQPIDIIWINDTKIVHIEESVLPPKSMMQTNLSSYGQKIMADKVLEVKAGFSDDYGLQLGDDFFYQVINK
ncbi:MAG: DUF192 domain-containing protein [SAR324 cluster bacterium]|nr:DUF192 domain-containing protein [SAR324 cluster bacterium]